MRFEGIGLAMARGPAAFVPAAQPIVAEGLIGALKDEKLILDRLDVLQGIPADAEMIIQAEQLQGQQGRQGGLAGRAFGIAPAKVARDQALRAPNMATIREYAHALRSNWTEGSRVDFTETVYWNAGVKTDVSGAATVSFNLSDSVTSFRVLADAFGRDGGLGSSISEIESVQPFSIEPKIPLQVTSGDVIELPSV
jgi:hypothetical protein